MGCGPSFFFSSLSCLLASLALFGQPLCLSLALVLFHHVLCIAEEARPASQGGFILHVRETQTSIDTTQ